MLVHSNGYLISDPDFGRSEKVQGCNFVFFMVCCFMFDPRDQKSTRYQLDCVAFGKENLEVLENAKEGDAISVIGDVSKWRAPASEDGQILRLTMRAKSIKIHGVY